ncbi:MAG: glycosyltransferase [bacterium]|nr:glycosyltransferase [bacterium]
MNVGTWIVCSLARREAGLPSTAHALFERMPEPVWWIDHPLSWKDAAGNPGAWHGWPRHARVRSGPGWPRPDVDPQDGAPRPGDLHLVTPSPAPVHALPDALFDRFTSWHARSTARWLTRRLAGAPRPHVLWNAFDVAWGTLLARHLPHDLLVHHAYDDLASARHVARHGLRFEPELLARADLVVTTSPALLAAHSGHPGVHLVTNGVDFERFARAPGWPDPLEDWPRPRIGFVGHLEDRLDVEMLLAAACERPGWSWILVGPVHPAARDRLAPLLALPQVAWLGPRPAFEVPRLLAALDVGLLPFVSSAQTRAVYPLKLHEYLAAGLPVVATPFADLPGAEPVVHRVREGDLVGAVEQALGARDEVDRARRQGVARQADWQVRVRQVRALVEEALVARHAPRAERAP